MHLAPDRGVKAKALKRLTRHCGRWLGLACLVASYAAGAEPMRYVYHPPESPLDRRYLYHWKILETALQRTTEEYGAFVMEPSLFMTEKRQAFELRQATGKLTVMYLSTIPKFERDLVPIRIPVDKDLGGFRIRFAEPRAAPRKKNARRVSASSSARETPSGRAPPGRPPRATSSRRTTARRPRSPGN